MKLIATLFGIAVATTLAAGGARAQDEGGIAINWNGCIGDGVVERSTFACNTNVGTSFVLYVSLIPPVDMPQFAATTAIVDVYVSGGTVPPWWQAGAGQCRPGAISMSFDPAGFSTSCPDLWLGLAPMSVFALQFGVYGRPDLVRLYGGAAVPVGTEFLLPADGVERTVSRIVITRARTTGANACSGCATCAVFEPRECNLQQPNPLSSYRLTRVFAPWPFKRWWNGNCDPTPTQNRSWGQIKGLYR